MHGHLSSVQKMYGYYSVFTMFVPNVTNMFCQGKLFLLIISCVYTSYAYNVTFINSYQ